MTGGSSDFWRPPQELLSCSVVNSSPPSQARISESPLPNAQRRSVRPAVVSSSYLTRSRSPAWGQQELPFYQLVNSRQPELLSPHQGTAQRPSPNPPAPNPLAPSVARAEASRLRLNPSVGTPSVAPSAPRPPSLLPQHAQQQLEAFYQEHITPSLVLEIAAPGTSSRGTSFALSLCRIEQERSQALQGRSSLCAILDPSRSLYAPGVKRRGVDLNRLLVVQPNWEQLPDVALHLAQTKLFSLLLVDLRPAPHLALSHSLGPWVRAVRRLQTALQNSPSTVLLLTDPGTHRPLPLPVDRRMELHSPTPGEFSIQVHSSSGKHPPAVHFTREPGSSSNRQTASSLGSRFHPESDHVA